MLYRLAPSHTLLEQEFFAEVTAAVEGIKPRHELAQALRLIASDAYAKEAVSGLDWFAKALAAAREVEDEPRRAREFKELCVALRIRLKIRQ